jgi:predicted permease
MSMWSRLRNAVRGDRLIDDIDEELASHLAEAVEHGRDPDEARRAFGPPLRHREASRDMRHFGWLADFLTDIRYGARLLRRQPGFLAAAVLSLGLGIGANSAIFSVIDALEFRTLPVAEPDHLLAVGDRATEDTFSYPEYVSLRDGTQTVSSLIAASSQLRVPVGVDGESSETPVKIVSGNYFSGLGVSPAVGHAFTVADETATVAVISDHFWRSRFEGSSSAIGRAITIDGLAFTIIGVAPADFSGETPGDAPALWATMAAQAPDMRADRGFTWLHLLGRQRPGTTIDQVAADLAALLVRVRPSAPADETESRLIITPGGYGLGTIRNHLLNPLRIAMVLAVIVLLVVCTNLAGLQLARGTQRQWEIGMRLAMGATRARVVRQLLAESALLAAIGGVVGVLVAAWGQAAVLELPLAGRPIALELQTNLRVTAFTAIVSIAAALVFGFAPAWRAARSSAIRGSSRVIGRERAWGLRSVVIAAQVALSLVLLAGSVMFTRTINNLETQDVGFHADHVLLVPIVGERGFRPALSVAIPRLLDRVSQTPGVTSASVALGGTLGAIGGARVQVEGRATRDRLGADWVGPNYFRTAGMTILAGRDFAMTDDERGQRVVVVNEKMARQYFGGANAIGHRVTFNTREYVIVGVASDAKYSDLRETTPAFVYFPTLQTQSGVNTLEVRTANVTPLGLAAIIRPLIREVEPHWSAGTALTLSDRIDRKLGREHLVADVAGCFGLVALALLCIGVYGSLAYAVSQRRRELAVRLALGAPRAGIMWMVVSQLTGIVMVGLALGAVGFVFVGRLVRPLLFGLAPADPWTLLIASIALVLISGLAAGVPARAASRVDPASVLQE